MQPTDVEDEKKILALRPSLGGLCGATEVDLLACADTVEDIIPKNNISRYLKNKYETDSLRADDDDEGDESTLNTLNTTNFTLNTLNSIGDTYDGTLNQNNTFDDTLDQETLDSENKSKRTSPKTSNEVSTESHPFDESIDTLKINADGTVEITTAADTAESSNKSTFSTLQKPDFPELLGDLAEEPPTYMVTHTLADVASAGTHSEAHNTSGNTTDAVVPSANLKFAPWIGDEETERPKPQLSTTIVPSPSPSPSKDDSEGQNNISVEGGRTTCSNTTATDRSIEVIGRGIPQPPKPIKKKKRSFLLPHIGKSSHQRGHEDEAKQDETRRQALARERRWNEMKSILQATAESNNTSTDSSGKKKGAWKKSVRRSMESLRIKKKKSIDHPDDEEGNINDKNC